MSVINLLTLGDWEFLLGMLIGAFAGTVLTLVMVLKQKS